MPLLHVTDQPLAGSIEGSLKVGERNGLIVAGDLTSEAAALAAVDTKAAKKHVTDQALAIPVKDAVTKADDVLTGATSGGSLANIYAAVPGDFDNFTSVL